MSMVYIEVGRDEDEEAEVTGENGFEESDVLLTRDLNAVNWEIVERDKDKAFLSLSCKFTCVIMRIAS